MKNFIQFQIITRDDKKTCPSNPVIRGKDIDNKFNRNLKHKKSRKHQKTNGIESTCNKVEDQDVTTKENEKLDIWFDNVDPVLLEENMHSQNTKKLGEPGIINKKKTSSNTFVKEESFEG